jgi:PAS domain S-box-containing protein
LRFLFHFTVFSYESRDQKVLVWYGADTTDFKRLEEAYRAVVEHSLQGLAIYQQGRIVFANPAYAQMLGYSLEELYAMDSARTANLIYFEDSPRLNEHMQAALSGNAVAPRIEFRVVRKDGTLRWIETSFNVIHYRDQPALQATSVDIADRKQMESEQARLIRELETKNAELERFTYTVSHDLKSPLITIRGFLGFLERDTMANNKARIAADVQRITEATEKMQRLLNDVLSLSRVGRVVNPPENVAFGAIAAEAVERVAGQIRQRSVYVKIADGLPVVRVDRERVIEVVQNLLDNAVKFMGEQWNPTIQIGTRGTDHKGFPILFVEDNGIGIDPVFHDQVFGLFNKLDPSSEGTGIGLAIVKRVIETHGGRIWVESEGRGKGARFLFTLPPVTAIVQPGPAK